MELATAAEVISDAAVELGLASADIADPFGSTDANILQLCRLLKRAGRSLAKARDWSHLTREYTFSTVASTASYVLPTDYARMKGATAWNRTTSWQLGEPVGAADWQAFQASTVAGVLTRPFRLFANKLYIYPTPTAAETIAYEYVSNLWVIPSAQTWPTSCTSKPTLYTDTLYFDEELLVAALKLLWKQAKGQDTTAAQNDFNQAFGAVGGDDGAAPVINLLGPRSGVRMLDYDNIPESGFGQ